MNRTTMRIAWLSLKRDKVALVMTFVLPIAFFSIFVVIFSSIMGGGSGGGLPQASVVIVDEDQTEVSQRIANAIRAEEGLKGPSSDDPRPPILDDRQTARRLVSDGGCDVAVIIPAGFSEVFGLFGPAGAKVTLYADTIVNPVGHQIVGGLLQKIAMTATPDIMMERGLEMFATYGGGLSESQQAAMDFFLPQLRQFAQSNVFDGNGEPGGDSSSTPSFDGMIRAEVVNVKASDDDDDQDEGARMVAYFAASIGVMFLLFAMSGAAGALLEEDKNGTLERVLSSKCDMGTLLRGYWLFAALVGFVQLFVMFIWAWAVFGLDLWSINHLAGFVVMTAVTALAASSFGLVLGTACRSQAQLQGMSTVVILLMSAVGGSMVPRFILQNSPLMDKLGLATFNAWSIDGYRAVFYNDLPVWHAWPQVLVLAAMGVVFYMIARLLARRWDAA